MWIGTKYFTEEQIAFALRQAESGTSVAEVIRKLGISEKTFYRWKKRFAGDQKLKQLVADLSLDKKMLQDVLSKTVRPAVKRVLVRKKRVCYRGTERRACRVRWFARSSFRYKSRRNQRAELRVRL